MVFERIAASESAGGSKDGLVVRAKGDLVLVGYAIADRGVGTSWTEPREDICAQFELAAPAVVLLGGSHVRKDSQAPGDCSTLRSSEVAVGGILRDFTRSAIIVE